MKAIPWEELGRLETDPSPLPLLSRLGDLYGEASPGTRERAQLAAELAAVLATRLGQRSDAIDWYEKALSDASDPAWIHELVGLYLADAQTTRGLAFLANLPGDTSYERARMLAAQGDDESVIASLQNADDAPAETQVLLANSLTRLGDDAAACAALRRAADSLSSHSAPDWSSLHDGLVAKSRAACLNRLGDSDAADAVVREQLLRNVGDPPF